MKQLFRKFYKSWYLEISLGIIIVLGVIYLTKIKLANEWVAAVLHVLDQILISTLVWFQEFIASDFGKKVVFGVIASVALVLLVLWRIIWRLRSTNKFTATTCPNCGNPLVRIKSHSWQKTVRPLLPVRRFYCRSCGWKGFRIKSSEGTPLNISSSKRTRIHVDKIS